MKHQLIIFLLSISILGITIITRHKTPEPHTSPPADTPTQNASDCLGEQDPYYSLGYGIKHYYQGEITPGQRVDITLSCDHTYFELQGAVTQTISEPISGKDAIGEIADLIAGTEVVYVKHDLNGDGYNDLESIALNGQGVDGVDVIYVWLFNPDINQFVYSESYSTRT